MTTTEFNEKYEDYLEGRHYGLAINHEKVIDYLDRVFSDILIHYPNFEYSQIKLKFGMARVYLNNEPDGIAHIMEQQINEILKEDEKA